LENSAMNRLKAELRTDGLENSAMNRLKAELRTDGSVLVVDFRGAMV